MKSNLQLVTSSQVGLHLHYMKLNYHSNMKPRKLEFMYGEGLAKQKPLSSCEYGLPHLLNTYSFH